MAFELEMPAVYLDAVLMDLASGLVVFNRDHEPEETEVSASAPISFDLANTFDGLDFSSANVFINGVLAFDNGQFQPGFSGQALSIQPDTLRIIISRAAPFRSQEEIEVRLVAKASNNASLDTAWSFYSEDLSASQILGVQAREQQRLRLSFSEAVEQDSSLNPKNYSLGRLSIPAVEASIIAVEVVTDSTVDLLTDIELTAGATYSLSVEGIGDLQGNSITSPARVTFVGYAPFRPANRRFDLYSMMPNINRREDKTGDLKLFLCCLQEITDLLLLDIDRFTEILDPDLAPEIYLDRMLEDLGNPFQFDLAVIDKRRLLNVLVAIYREKGTEPGLKNAIRFFLGLEIGIVSLASEAMSLCDSHLGDDFVLGPSNAGSARIFEVSCPRALEREERRRVKMLIDYMKPAHTHARLLEPIIPEIIDDLELGLSELGRTWILH